jgi:hypothetical protein
VDVETGAQKMGVVVTVTNGASVGVGVQYGCETGDGVQAGSAQDWTGADRAEIESAGSHRRALRTGVKPSEDMTNAVPVATDNSVVEQWVLQSGRAAISRMTAMNVKKAVTTESFIFGEVRMTVKRICSSGL